MTDLTPDPESDGSPTAPGHNFPIFGVPASAFRRFHATVLSPDGADVIGDEEPPHPTVYRPDRLILPGLNHRSFNDGPFQELERLGKLLRFRPVVVDDPERPDRRTPTCVPLDRLAEQLGYAERLDAVARSVVELVPDTDRVGPPIDAWEVLQLARRDARRAEQLRGTPTRCPS